MMNKFLKRLIALTTLLTLIIITPASAAPQPSTPLGNDISYPQCGRRLPPNHAFGIVGVNGGKANIPNTCLGEQLKWAHRAVGGTTQPKAQLYVNTANPGEVIDQVTTWPTSSTADNPYHASAPCDGANSLSCSWQYGRNRAIADIDEFFVSAANGANVDSNPSHYVWWLDVETMNTWQSGSDAALARNVASLEGMTAAFKSRDITSVGIYSTNYQWGVIVGNQVSTTSNLNYTKNWLAGGGNLTGAKNNCTKPSLTLGSTVTLTQFVSKNLDYNYSCVG